jgi:hypothetical protein
VSHPSFKEREREQVVQGERDRWFKERGTSGLRREGTSGSRREGQVV